jgi:hypothetical protein
MKQTKHASKSEQLKNAMDMYYKIYIMIILFSLQNADFIFLCPEVRVLCKCSENRFVESESEKKSRHANCGLAARPCGFTDGAPLLVGRMFETSTTKRVNCK